MTRARSRIVVAVGITRAHAPVESTPDAAAAQRDGADLLTRLAERAVTG